MNPYHYKAAALYSLEKIDQSKECLNTLQLLRKEKYNIGMQNQIEGKDQFTANKTVLTDHTTDDHTDAGVLSDLPEILGLNASANENLNH